MLKRIKGLLCIWLVVLMMIGVVVRPVEAILNPQYIVVYTGTRRLSMNEGFTDVHGVEFVEGKGLYDLVSADSDFESLIENHGNSLEEINEWYIWEVDSGHVVDWVYSTSNKNKVLEGEELAEYVTSPSNTWLFEPYYLHQLTTQPSSSNNYTVEASGLPSLYAWYLDNSELTVTTENTDTTIKAEGASNGSETSTYSGGSWTSVDDEHWRYFFKINDLQEGDLLTINFTGLNNNTEFASIKYGSSAVNVPINNGKVQYLIPESNTYTVSLYEWSNNVITASATVQRAVQTGDTLVNGEDSKTYICRVMWQDGTIKVTDHVTFESSSNTGGNTGNTPTPVEPPKSTVEFVVDGKVWRTYRVTKGADIKMPEVPEKEGYVGTWSHDGENIRTATTINAVYTKIEVDPKDLLKEYSNFQLGVYINSRVHTITVNEEITVEGYMFKTNSDCSKEDSIWREIIFVNEDDYSIEKAYRKQADSIYAPWLNSNPNATANGKYNLDYANYSVTFDVDDVNSYVSNTPTTMAKGSYLVYMRISDGTNSYLFPLVDRVLSDGTTMENTGTLPKGFEVVDSTTRALRYVVE